MQKNSFDKLALFIIGLSVGFTVGIALVSWHWFPEEIWWHNPLAIIPQKMLSYVALLAPFVVTLISLLLRRKVVKPRSQESQRDP